MTKQLSQNLRKEKKLSTTEWILKHGIKTEDGIPFDFEKRKFLIDFYNDTSPRQAVMASAQVGKTVGVYVRALKQGMEDNLNILLSEPTQTLRDDLTKSKLNRLIEANPIFKQNVKGDLNLKTVGKSVLYLQYTYGSAGGIGVSADACYYDEVSRSNPEMISRFNSRLLNSEYKHEMWISNPAVPDDLLHKKFKASDQKHWAIRCDHCGKRQILNYDGLPGGHKGNVCRERKIFVCQHCDMPLSVQSRIDGEWVAKYASRTSKDPDYISGYWINQLMRHNCDVYELVAKEKENMAMFMNFYLGLPYAGSDVTVDAETIRKFVVEPVRPTNNIVAGLDVGASQEGSGGHHWIVASNGTIFAMGKAKDFNELGQVMNRFGVEQAVVDYMPEYEGAKNLQAMFPQQIMRCRFLPNRTTKPEIVNYEEDKGMVHVVKHLMFDNLVNDIANGRYKFALNENDPMLRDFCDQMSNMAKIAELDTAGNPIFKWEAPEGSHDHFAMAFLYMQVAQERLELLKPVNHLYNAEDSYESRYGLPQDDDVFNPKNDQPKSWLDL
jgi:hypothetical protein